MKRFLFAFVLGMVTGAAGLWYIQPHLDPAVLEQTHSQTIEGATRFKALVQSAYAGLTSETVRNELAAHGMVVREKAQQAGQAILDATANARTTATIKFKFFQDPTLPSLHINVDTTGGLVTLSGTVTSHDQVAKAVRLALETEGVTKVVSTIQVNPKA